MFDIKKDIIEYYKRFPETDKNRKYKEEAINCLTIYIFNWHFY